MPRVNLSGRLFAKFYDRFMAATEQAGLAARRAELLRGAHGSVVEIGAGTGANLARYPPEVNELVLVEPEKPMADRLREHLARAAAPARIVEAPAEALPLPDGSFDVAVTTLVLCTVRDPVQSLAELRRVLRPGGKLLFLEHVRSDDPALAKWQDRLRPLWVRVGHGCQCNRATLETIQAGGFTVESVQHGRIPKAPPIVKPMIVGVAIAPAG
jgi:ubiquinone/menaquinone biosynthesis C-methylase UbiE